MAAAGAFAAWRAALFGRRVKGRGRPLLFRPKLFLPLALAPYLIGFAAAVLVVFVVDPYDIRPWGLRPVIADHVYPDDEWPLLSRAALQSKPNLVLLGSSPAMGITTAQMRQAFGPGARPVTLAHVFATPSDLGRELSEVEKLPGVRRVLLEVDYNDLLPASARFPPQIQRDSILSPSWSHVGDVRLSTAMASLNRLVYGVYDLPAWRRHKRPTFFEHKVPIPRDPALAARTLAAIKSLKGGVLGRPIAANCDSYPFITDVMAPAARALVAKGVELDIFFPPFPLAAYYDRSDYDFMGAQFGHNPFGPGPILPQATAFKLCIVRAAAKFGPLVRVHATDNDLSTTDNLNNYMDDLHILNPAVYLKILQHISAGDDLLTPANFDSYQHQLEANILKLATSPPPELTQHSAAGRSSPEPLPQ